MSDDRPTRDSMSIEEATISNMWKIAATVEVLERLGRIIERGSGWRGKPATKMRALPAFFVLTLPRCSLSLPMSASSLL